MKKGLKNILAIIVILPLLLGGIIPLITNNSAFAATVDLAEAMEARTFSNSTISDQEMPYRIYIPENYSENTQYKLLFMLHGAGERGTDNLQHINFSTGMVWAQKIIGNVALKNEFIIVAPQCPLEDKWVDWTNLSALDGHFDDIPQTTASKMAAAILFDTINNYNIDLSRMYITGLSMGGLGTYEFLARYPGLFAGAVPMCGACDPDTYERVALTPVWTFHCEDDPEVNYAYNKQMVENLRSIGAGVLYTEYHGIGHNSWIEGYRNENAFWWLISQQRKTMYWSAGTASNTVQSTNKLAQYGTPIFSNPSPSGAGSKEKDVIRNGFADVYEDNATIVGSNWDYTWQQYDTYGMLYSHEDYFGYEFTQTCRFEKVEYQSGIYFGDGGWFAGGIKVQVKQNDVWVDATITNIHGYPVVAENTTIDVNQYPGFERYTFEIEPIDGDGIRVIGLAGGSGHFTSCAELEVTGAILPETSVAKTMLVSGGTPIVSNTSPAGAGSKDINVICNGFANVDVDHATIMSATWDYTWQQYDTYGNLSVHEDYFGYEYQQSMLFSKVIYQDGIHFDNSGGWFANGARIQVRNGGIWTDVQIINDPGYPIVAQGVDIDNSIYGGFNTFTFQFVPMEGDAIRIIGLAGGAQNFVSCAELEVYQQVGGESTSDTTVTECQPIAPAAITDSDIRSKIDGAWVGQMCGVVWGASTEFSYKGVMMNESQVPSLSRLNFNDAFTQDDLYVEIPFIEALKQEGFNIPISTLGEYFANTSFPLWHGNDMARNNILNGIAAPLSGSYLYNSCCEDIDWQIEADFVGMVSPGLVNVASNLGFDYGHVIGYADGAYGGTYVAAMHAKAFTAENILSIIISGQQSIPEGSKFRALIDDVMNWYVNDVSFEDCWKNLQDKYADDDRCAREGFGGSAPFNIDAKLNAGYCLMGLLYGENDMEKSMKLSMMCGQDSDCNPSTVGSILGNFYGIENIPDNLKAGINYTDYKFSYTSYNLQDAIDAVYQLAVKNVLENGGNIEDGIWTIPQHGVIVPVRLEVWEDMPSIEFSVGRSNKTVTVNAEPYYSKGIKSITWDFGDGTVATTANATHTYKRIGEYTLTLSVVGNDDTVGTRVITLSISVDNNIAGEGTVIINSEAHGGVGSSDVNVIIDGQIGASSTTQYDTYYSDYAPAHDDYFGIVFPSSRTINKVVYTTGYYFSNGGWFESVKIQVLQNGSWTDVELTNNPNYPNAQDLASAGKMFATYTFLFDDITCDGVRVYGPAGGTAHFASCSELEVYGTINASLEQTSVNYTFEEETVTLNYDSLYYIVVEVKLNGKTLEESDYILTETSISFTKAKIKQLFDSTNTVTLVFENGTETSATINVMAVETDLLVDASAVTKTYIYGHSLDTTGLVVNVIMSDDSQRTVEIGSCSISGYNATTIGTQTVTVSYGSFAKTFLVQVVADKTELNAAISNAESLDKTTYTSTSFSALSSALQQAYTVVEDANATPNEVDSAINAISQAQLALVERANKTALSETIAQAEALAESDYTSETYAILKQALVSAKAVEENIDAVQTDADSAVAMLVEAQASLVTLDSLRIDKFGAAVSTLAQLQDYDQLYTDIVEALNIYNTVENKEAVQTSYIQLQAEIARYNQWATAVNTEISNASKAVVGSVVGVASALVLLAAAVVVCKKYF